MWGSYRHFLFGCHWQPAPLSGSWSASATDAGFMRVLLAHSSFDPCRHHAGIGLDETHLLTVGPEEQIEVSDEPILIRREEGTGTVWVDGIGVGIGDVLRDSAVIAERLREIVSNRV